MDFIGSGEAAKMLGVTNSRVQQLLIAGVLRGKKLSGVWLVSRASVVRYSVTNRKPGRKVTRNLTKKSTRTEANTP